MPKRRWQQAQENTARYLQQVPALELLNLLPTAVLGVGLLLVIAIFALLLLVAG